MKHLSQIKFMLARLFEVEGNFTIKDFIKFICIFILFWCFSIFISVSCVNNCENNIRDWMVCDGNWPSEK